MTSNQDEIFSLLCKAMRNTFYEPRMITTSTNLGSYTTTTYSLSLHCDDTTILLQIPHSLVTAKEVLERIAGSLSFIATTIQNVVNNIEEK